MQLAPVGCWSLTIVMALVAHLLGMRTQQAALSGLDPLVSVDVARRILGCARQDDLRLAPDGTWPARHQDRSSPEVRGIRRDGLA